MKQDIRTVREMCLSDRHLCRALDSVVMMAERYEKLRKLNPRHYAELYERNIAGEGTFDDLVDKLK